MSTASADAATPQPQRGIGVFRGAGIPMAEPDFIILIISTSPLANLTDESLMAHFMAYSPPWSPMYAYYRLGYGCGDTWYWPEMEAGVDNGVDAGSPWSQGYMDPAGNE